MNDPLTDSVFDFDEIADLFTNDFCRCAKKTYPILWGEVLGLEKSINGASMRRDEEEVSNLFRKYLELVRNLRSEFDAIKSKRERVWIG